MSAAGAHLAWMTNTPNADGHPSPDLGGNTCGTMPGTIADQIAIQRGYAA
jgi:hypothetical protein